MSGQPYALAARRSILASASRVFIVDLPWMFAGICFLPKEHNGE